MAIFEARSQLFDQHSRSQFDQHLCLLALGPWKYRFEPSCDLMFQILAEEKLETELSTDYMGLPLKCYTLKPLRSDGAPFRVVTTMLQMDLLNRFSQYFPSGPAAVCRPSRGETVLDCGSCVADISAVFANAVGPSGRVYAFDPMPQHHRYGALQIQYNPDFSSRIRFVAKAISEQTHTPSDPGTDISSEIQSNFTRIDSIPCTTIDDFVEHAQLDRVDLIKMDIEGAEPRALTGARRSIQRWRPRLAISAFHDRSHLTELIKQIHSFEPGYCFGFGQHSPIFWEAVLYAWHPSSLSTSSSCGVSQAS
jgi:FkbM family methyltransferase